MRIVTHRFIAVFSMALTAALTLSTLSQNVVAQEAMSPDENLKQIEAALHARQHAERQAVDLHEFENVDVVLVPFDDLAVDHRRGFDRHQFVETVAGEDESAGMLRQVTRRSDQLAGQLQCKTQTPVAEIEIEILGMLRLDAFASPARDLRGQHLDQIFGQPERLAYIAQRAF